MAMLIRGLVTSALLAKVIQIARRQLAKPENQRRIKDAVNRATTRGNELAGSRRATG